MKRVAKVLVALIVVTSLLGCSLFRSSTQKINVRCSEQNAKLFINGNQEQNPATTDVKRNRDYSVQCHKDGYQVASKVVGHHMNETGILDIIGGVLILFPALGLLSAGAWSLDETDVNVPMFAMEKK